MTVVEQPHAGDARRSDVVSLRRVTHRFGTGKSSVLALDDVSLSVAPGEFVTIVGPSGCGKTTMLRMVAGLLAPTAGEVKIDGAAVQGPADSIGMVFQQPLLLPWRSVLNNVLMPMAVRGRGRRRHRERAMELLELVGLTGFENHLPATLSGGMQQRVALARSLMNEPRLLLMDEPFGALDAMSRERMNLELLQIVRRTGTSVLLITHSVPEAVFLGDRVAVMTARPGRMQEIVDIDLGRDRTAETMASPEFARLTGYIRRYFQATPVDSDTAGSSGALDA